VSQPVDAPSDAPDETGMSPSEAFALLANETRIEILRAFHDATVHQGAGPDPGPDANPDASAADGRAGTDAGARPVSFSELYDRTDVADSGRFNYHLDQLTDHFVRAVDDGYVLRQAGWKVVRSVFAGTFTDRVSVDPFPAPGACYHCDGDLRAWYADERLTVDCVDCGRSHVSFPFAPGALDGRSPEETLRAFHHHVRHHYCLAADGVCPECLGRIETTVTTDATLPGLDVQVDHRCTRCGHDLHSAVGLNLLDNPDVLTFHAERGVDPTTRPFWTFDWCVSDVHTVVESTDPVEVRLDVPCDGDRLCVVVDDTASVRAVEGCARPLDGGRAERG
jgi:hypothetical protein